MTTKALEEKRRKDRERQRKRRANMSAEDLEKKREYDRKYKEQKVAEGSWKKYRTAMSEREMRQDRKRVRDRVRKCRERKKEVKITEDFLQTNTPPESPNPEIPNDDISVNPTLNRKRGRKKKNLNRSTVYRLLKKTEAKLKIAEQRAEKYSNFILDSPRFCIN